MIFQSKKSYIESAAEEKIKSCEFVQMESKLVKLNP